MRYITISAINNPNLIFLHNNIFLYSNMGENETAAYRQYENFVSKWMSNFLCLLISLNLDPLSEMVKKMADNCLSLW
jgi:hypothetical protein